MTLVSHLEARILKSEKKKKPCCSFSLERPRPPRIIRCEFQSSKTRRKLILERGGFTLYSRPDRGKGEKKDEKKERRGEERIKPQRKPERSECARARGGLKHTQEIRIRKPFSFCSSVFYFRRLFLLVSLLPYTRRALTASLLRVLEFRLLT